MPNNWKTYKLGDFAQLRKEGIKPSEFNGEKYIGLEHIGQGNFLLDGIGNASDVTSNKSKFVQGDILYGKIRPYFKKVYRPKFSGICSTDMLIINSSNEEIITQDYLHQVIKTQEFTDKATETSTGTKMPRADWKSLEKIDFEIPDLDEQKAIAKILSAIDNKIENNLAINKTLEDMAMALYKHWFVDKEDLEVDLMPLSEIVSYIVDNRGKTAPTAKDGTPLIATNCVKNHNIFPTYDKVRYIDKETYDTWFRSHPISGDILFVNKGKPGSVNLVPDPVDFCIAQDMVALRVNNQIISNYYLFAYLRQNKTQFEISNKSVGTTIPHLKKTDLLNFEIPIPNKKYLDKFTDKVSPIFDELNILRKENLTLTILRSTLLPKLISGEVRLKEFQEQIEQVL